MSIVKEFKEFAVKGNMLDMAVGIIIGGAFGKIITSLVNDVIMPVFGAIMGGNEISSLVVVLAEAQGEIPAVELRYGLFFQNIIDFLIIAFSIFMVIKGINSMRKKEEASVVEAPPEPSAEEKLLGDIKGLLQDKLQ